MRVLLINMPFAALDSPSLALGMFKSRLLAEGVACDVQDLNWRFAEEIGYDDYAFVLQLSAVMAGEQLFARSLFGDLVPPDSEYDQQIVANGDASADVPARLAEIRRHVPAFLQRCIEALPWPAYDVIGFTSLFEQNLPSLSLARMVKLHYPETTIVFGGANCEEIMGVTLHQCFPFVDYVCSGEADDSFPELVNRLAFGHPVSGIGGLVRRDRGETVYEKPAAMVRELDTLPIPDYDDYFIQRSQSPIGHRVKPSVLMESARGCWWGQKSHCTFCGLNGLTMEFRVKKAPRAIGEITHLLRRYDTRIVRFVDNILSPNYFKELLPEIARQRIQADFICEVKSNLKKPQIQALADAHFSVQAGIENLSTHTLDLMGKGSNALINLQTLKWCMEKGVFVDWNLLYGFPGEVPHDYERNLELARVATHLSPPSGCGPIRLDRFSPNFDRADEFGLTNVRPLKYYRYLYPFNRETLMNLVYYFDFDYEQRIDDGGYLSAIEETVTRWKRREDVLYAERSGGTVVIHDTRPVARWPEMIVSGVAARVLECCDRAQSLPRIVEALRQSGEDVTQEQVADILNQFLDSNLLVREGNRYLSVVVLTYASEFAGYDAEQHPMRSPHHASTTVPLVQHAAAS